MPHDIALPVEVSLTRIADALVGIEQSLDMFFGFDADSGELGEKSISEKTLDALQDINDTLKFMSTGSNQQPGPIERISMKLEELVNAVPHLKE